MWSGWFAFCVAFVAALDTPAEVESWLRLKTRLAVEYVQKQAEIANIPGLALSILYNNKPILTKGFGTKRLGQKNDPVDENTIFEIGSVSKSFVAVALAKLVDDGKVTWKDPVKKHLPWFELQDKYAEKTLTIEDLLLHNGPFARFSDYPLFYGVYDTERKFIESLKYAQDTRPLRSGFFYSNTGFTLLGQVIEGVTGKPWHQYMAEAIWKPLGMTSTYAHIDLAPQKQVAQAHYTCNGKAIGPYSLTGNLSSAVPRMRFAAAGSIVSSAKDLAAFAQLVLNKGGRLFKSPEAISHAITVHNPIDFSDPELLANSVTFESDGNGAGSGYGFDIVGHLLFGERYFGKNGATAAHMSVTSYLPSQGISIVLLVSSRSYGGSFAESFRVNWIRAYIAGIFLDENLRDIEKGYKNAVDTFDKLLPPQPCDAHYFEGTSWPTSNASNLDRSLVGTYSYVVSPQLYGNIVVSVRNASLYLQVGAFEGNIVAVSRSTYVLAFDFMGPRSQTVQFNTTNPAAIVLSGLGPPAVKLAQGESASTSSLDLSDLSHFASFGLAL